jgi:hypothetical protein
MVRIFHLLLAIVLSDITIFGCRTCRAGCYTHTVLLVCIRLLVIHVHDLQAICSLDIWARIGVVKWRGFEKRGEEAEEKGYICVSVMIMLRSRSNISPHAY